MSRENFRHALAQQEQELHLLPPLPPNLPPPPPPGVVVEWLPPPPVEAPRFIPASSIVAANIVRPPLLVDNLLHRGCKMLLAGGSKSHKTWCLIDLAVSVSSGSPWWNLQTHAGAVVYLNFELIEPFFHLRVAQVCEAKGVAQPEHLYLWTLRNYSYDLSALKREFAARIAALPVPLALIIVDPIYKALGSLDENSASDMAQLMLLIEGFAAPSGAAIAFGSHYAKGNASSKEAKDRASGSGVLVRDPDVLVMVTQHQQDDCYVVNAILRYLPFLRPFVIRWSFPLMAPDAALNPDDLYVSPRAPSAPPPRNEILSPDQILEVLELHGLSASEWAALLRESYGTDNGFVAGRAHLLASGRVRERSRKFYRNN